MRMLKHRLQAFPANTLIRSSGLHSLAVSASELLLRKRPGFLASRRFATGKPDTDALSYLCRLKGKTYTGLHSKIAPASGYPGDSEEAHPQ